MLVLNSKKSKAMKAFACDEILSSHLLYQFYYLLSSFADFFELEFPFELTKAKGWRTFVEREHSTHHTVSVWSVKH